MAELPIVDSSNNQVGTVPAVPEIFEVPVREHLVQKYVAMQLAKRRRGTACTKSNYGQLSGSGKKPWRQKGTGRARHGKTRSAIWRGGLTIFGPTPRDYSFKMTKKTKTLALKSILTERARNDAICVIDKIELEQPKTKEAVKLLEALGLPERTLFLLDQRNENLELAVRNLPDTDVLLLDGLNAFDLLVHEKIVFTAEALKKVEGRLNG